MSGPSLRAVSDLHVGHRGNVGALDAVVPGHEGDWLIVAGDVAERVEQVVDTLRVLSARFARVLWVPGNHELWIGRDDLESGDASTSPTKYETLVQACRDLGVDTPEDPYPLWPGSGRTDGTGRPGGPESPVRVVPMFLLYDHSWTRVAGEDRHQALARAKAARVVATDEYLIDPAPYGDTAAWCRDRLLYTTRRLAALDPGEQTVLVNHWPLVREPTEVLAYPDFALWCGTEQTADWHRRYRAAACVYGHLHIPRSSEYDGVPFEEVSLGYPREWGGRGRPEPLARVVLPAERREPVRWVRDPSGPPRIAAPGDSGPELTEEDVRR